MIKQGNNTTRSLDWDDEASAESRFRRVQQSVPPSGRGLPGMPLEMADPEGDDAERPVHPRNPWWRPASRLGRIFLAICLLAVLGASATGVVLLRSYLVRDTRFRIAGTENIEATGTTQVTRADVLPVFGEDIGRNVFFVPLNDRRKQLEQIPWVQSAVVMRLLPDQIRVALTERQPIAFVRQGQQIGLVDAGGVLLSMPAAAMAKRHYSFPVVTGIDPGDPLSSRRARMAVYQRLMAELDSGNQPLSQQISEIDLTDPEDARVLMPEPGADILAHFGDDRFLERYQRYKAHIAEWRQQYPRLSSVDLRYDQQVVLQMSGAAAVQAPLSGQPMPLPTEAKPSAARAAQPQPVNLQAVSAEPSADSLALSHEGAAEPANPGPVTKSKPVVKASTKAQRKSGALTTQEKIARAMAAQKKKHEKAQRTASAQHNGDNTMARAGVSAGPARNMP